MVRLFVRLPTVNDGVSGWVSLAFGLLVFGWSSSARLATASAPPVALDARARDAIDLLIEETIRCRGIPGLTLSVATSDDVILERGYGYADLASSREVTPQTLFPIASTTKAFTVTLLAIILENHPKNITWDTPLRSILGDAFVLYDHILTAHTTLRDILSHKTGIPDYFIPLMAGLSDSESRDHLIWRLRYHKPKHEFRTNFQYNNYMYGLAGYVTEELMGGVNWEQLVRTRILEPLGMTSTTFADVIEDWDSLATSYVIRNGDPVAVDKFLIRQTNRVGPAGSILSSAEDMARWLQFHLRGGVTESGERLLSEEALRETYREQMPSPTPMSTRDLVRPLYPITDVHHAYDMGWLSSIYRGYRRIWHSGSISTYKSQVCFYPDMDYGIYISCNGPPTWQTTWTVSLMMMHIGDLLMGEPPWLNDTTICSFPRPWAEPEEEEHPQVPPLPTDNIPLPVEHFEGNYSNPGFGNIHISYDSAREQLRMHMGELLEADLFYNSTAGLFYTNLTGRYWYMNERIPLRFKKSGYTDSSVNLEMPLYGPYETAETIPFFKDSNGYNQYRTSKNTDNNYCYTSAATPAILTGGIVFYLSFYCLVVLFM